MQLQLLLPLYVSALLAGCAEAAVSSFRGSMSVSIKQVQGISCTGGKVLQWYNLPSSLQIGTTSSGQVRLAFGNNNVQSPPSIGVISGTSYRGLEIAYWTMKYSWAGSGTGRYISVGGTLTNADGGQTATTANTFVVTEALVPTMCYLTTTALGAMNNGAKLAGWFTRSQTRMQVASYGTTNNGNRWLINLDFFGNLANGPTIFAVGNSTDSSTGDLQDVFTSFDLTKLTSNDLSNLTLSTELGALASSGAASGRMSWVFLGLLGTVAFALVL